MTTWAAAHPRWVDAALVLVAGADAVVTWSGSGPLTAALTALGCLALLGRRRAPLAVLALTLLAVPDNEVTAAGVIALYSLAGRSRSRRLLVACGTVWAALAVAPWHDGRFGVRDDVEHAVLFAYAAATAAAPLLLGQLVQARQDLARRLVEIERVKEHEQEMYAEEVLARERTRLAAEMHDVVSHQVSLIVLHAGGWEAAARDDTVREAAGTVRELGVQTLEELRTMVTLLRLSGRDDVGVSPAPTLDDLAPLVAGSGPGVRFSADLPGSGDVGLPTQRAVYRVVQESLTNVRKHSPGARTDVVVRHDRTHLTVSVENGPAARSALDLPGSGLGLVGLRERVDVLGGAFTAGPTPRGGYRVEAVVPLHSP